MLHTTNPIIKPEAGLLNLAEMNYANKASSCPVVRSLYLGYAWRRKF